MDNSELLKKVSNAAIYGNKELWSMNIDSFDWVPGVGLYGIYSAYCATKDKELLDFLIEWTDKHLMTAYEKTTVNSTCPLSMVIDLYKITKKNEYLKVCTDIAEYIISEAPITREGGLEHTVTEANGDFSEQMWADTLFMAVLFLVKMGIVVDKKYSDFAVKQLKIHLKYLFDDEKGLFYHGWNCAAENHMSAVFWARANAWIIYSTAEIISILGDFDGVEEVCGYIKHHAESLRKLQRKNGAFGTILDDETSYDEASAVAGIISGVKKSIELNILSEDYNEVYDKGIDYIKRSIDENGELLHVSSGTPIMKNAEKYKNVPICPTLYGQGLAAVALSME